MPSEKTGFQTAYGVPARGTASQARRVPPRPKPDKQTDKEIR
ncbi:MULTISPECIES: hypothetical protein [Neisseria]|nr:MULTISPECIES: hypothetical protein [Neisseria]